MKIMGIALTSLFLSLALAVVAQPPAPPDLGGVGVVTLERGKPVERALKPGEVHAYQVTLTKGQFFRASFDQKGIDITIAVFGPDAWKLATVDSPNGEKGVEPVRIVADADGVYRMEVSVLANDAKPGNYTARFEEILSPEQYTARLAAEAKKRAEIVRYLKSRAIPLVGVTAGLPTSDLQTLKRVFRNVRVKTNERYFSQS